MNVEILREDDYASASDRDKAFVERIKKALLAISYSFKDECPGIGSLEQFVTAVIYFSPLHLDFKACIPNSNAAAFFFNPQVEITEASFVGDELAPDILQRLKSDLAGYRERIRQP